MEIEIYLSTFVVCNPPLLMLVVLLVLCPSLLMLVQPALALMVAWLRKNVLIMDLTCQQLCHKIVDKISQGQKRNFNEGLR